MTTRLLILISLLFVNFSTTYAQAEGISDTMVMTTTDTTITELETEEVETITGVETNNDVVTSSPSFHQILKTKFIEGGAGFMGIV